MSNARYHLTRGYGTGGGLSRSQYPDEMSAYRTVHVKQQKTGTTWVSSGGVGKDEKDDGEGGACSAGSGGVGGAGGLRRRVAGGEGQDGDGGDDDDNGDGNGGDGNSDGMGGSDDADSDDTGAVMAERREKLMARRRRKDAAFWFSDEPPRELYHCQNIFQQGTSLRRHVFASSCLRAFVSTGVSTRA
jgi:hypothetical protein